MGFLRRIQIFFRLVKIFFINIWVKVNKQLIHISLVFKNLQGDSKQIFQNTLSINLNFLTVIIAFYIAITAYFIPQIHQIKLNRDLEFNHMLSEMDSIIPGKTSYKDYPQYYKNDTINIDKISFAITMKALFTSADYEKRNLNYFTLQRLTLKVMEYTDTLKLINLICSNPILNLPIEETDQIYRGQNYVPFSMKLYKKIDDFIRALVLSELLTMKIDINMILFCSEGTFLNRRNGESPIWVNSKLDSLKNDQLINPRSNNKSHIDYYEELIQETKNERMIFSKLYENMRHILDTYNFEINKLNFKIKSLEYMVSALNNRFLFYAIVFIFVMNILVPVILSNFYVNFKYALIYMLIGFAPYIFIIKKIIDYTQSVI
ncbi:MAG: hypothetical protein HQ522_03790 [Bacteroidetes bacterium]|nr:hypothetical protein [Bacteroidota bacterium]